MVYLFPKKTANSVKWKCYRHFMIRLDKTRNCCRLKEQQISETAQGVKALATQAGQSEFHPWNLYVRWRRQGSTVLPSDLCVHAMAHVTPPNTTVVTPKTKELGEIDTFLRRQRLHGIIPAETQAKGCQANVLRSKPVRVPMLRACGSPERAPQK